MKSENAVSSAKSCLLLLLVLINICKATAEHNIEILESPFKDYFIVKLPQGVNEQLPPRATLIEVSAQIKGEHGCAIKGKNELQDWNRELRIPCSLCEGEGFQLEVKYQDENSAPETFIIEILDPKNKRQTYCMKKEPNDQNGEKVTINITSIVAIIFFSFLLIVSFVAIIFMWRTHNRTRQDQPTEMEIMA